MNCRRCPHHVRHGQLSDDGETITFKDICGLRHKQLVEPDLGPKKGRGRGRGPSEIKRCPLPQGASLDCVHFPFNDTFDYFGCRIYQENFATQGIKNGVQPTKDFQYSERLAGVAVTDMELL